MQNNQAPALSQSRGLTTFLTIDNPRGTRRQWMQALRKASPVPGVFLELLNLGALPEHLISEATVHRGSGEAA